MMRFDRFTPSAQDAANRSIEILQRYGHNQVDTEHILLALLEQADGVVPAILEKMGVSVSAMTAKVDDVIAALPAEVEVSVGGFTVRAARQVGRNDPCPCGSGQKFKNCHGRERTTLRSS